MEQGDSLFVNMTLYTTLGTFSIIAFFIVNLFFLKKKKHIMSLRALNVQTFFAKKTNSRLLGSLTLWAIVEILMLSAVYYLPAGLVNTAFGNIVGTSENYFGLLLVMPVVMMAIFCFMGVDPLAQFDLITPALPAALVFVKSACFFEGCCYGIQSPYGVYFSTRGLFEVPVQLIEAFNALAIFLFLLSYKKFAKKGTMYPAYVFLYSITRFFSEFLRHEKNVFWIFKTYHILCFVGIVAGVAAFICVTIRREKLEAFLYRFSYKGRKIQ